MIGPLTFNDYGDAIRALDREIADVRRSGRSIRAVDFHIDLKFPSKTVVYVVYVRAAEGPFK